MRVRVRVEVTVRVNVKVGAMGRRLDSGFPFFVQSWIRFRVGAMLYGQYQGKDWVRVRVSFRVRSRARARVRVRVSIRGRIRVRVRGRVRITARIRAGSYLFTGCLPIPPPVMKMRMTHPITRRGEDALRLGQTDRQKEAASDSQSGS